LGAKNIYIDHELLMNETLILLDEKCTNESEKYRLCYPSKYFDKVYDIYFSRYKLYKNYYLNLKSNGVDFMIA
jgi:HD superfamily phosphohydrolase